jgi:hypothetical protein
VVAAAMLVVAAAMLVVAAAMLVVAAAMLVVAAAMLVVAVRMLVARPTSSSLGLADSHTAVRRCRHATSDHRAGVSLRIGEAGREDLLPNRLLQLLSGLVQVVD